MPYNNRMEQIRKRLFIGKKTGSKEREKLIILAAANECNTLVFSLDDRFFKSRKSGISKLIKHYDLNIEAGGHDLSLLLPRRLFFFHRDLFRMMQGKRKIDRHFCPTNPKTISIISERAKILIARTVQKTTALRIFHLLPDSGYENTWCACPACRAFRPAEQYLIAVNTTADILAKIDPDARLFYTDFDTAPSDAPRLAVRTNVYKGNL